jgi:hypothetical protein
MEVNMSYAVFNELHDNKYAYKYCQDKLRVEFSELNTHIFLLNYIYKDLTPLSELGKRYIAETIDIDTVEIKKSNMDILSQSEDLLIQLHPYYKCEYKKTIFDSLVLSFNQIVYRYVRSKVKPADVLSSPDWYLERIQKFIPYKYLPLFTEYTTIYHDFLSESGLGSIITQEMECIIDAGEKTWIPPIFEKEIETQHTIRNMLYIVLDESAQQFNELTPLKRLWIFSHIQGSFNVDTYSSQTIALNRYSYYDDFYPVNESLKSQPNPTVAFDKYSYAVDFPHTSEYDDYKELFKPLKTIDCSDLISTDLPDKYKSPLASIIKETKTLSDITFFKEYTVSNLEQLLYLEIFYMVNSDTTIRKCRNCQKYFVPSTKRSIYCNRVFKGNKTCAEIGSRNTFNNKASEEPALKLYIRAYKTHYARIYSGKITQDEFNSWSLEAKNRLEDVRANKLSIEDYKSWLKK